MQSTVMTSSSSGSFCGQLTPVHWFEPKACQIRESPSTNWGDLGSFGAQRQSTPIFSSCLIHRLVFRYCKTAKYLSFQYEHSEGCSLQCRHCFGFIAALNSQYLVASWQMRRTWSWYRPRQSAIKSNGLEMGSDMGWFWQFLPARKLLSKWNEPGLNPAAQSKWASGEGKNGAWHRIDGFLYRLHVRIEK